MLLYGHTNWPQTEKSSAVYFKAGPKLHDFKFLLLIDYRLFEGTDFFFKKTESQNVLTAVTQLSNLVPSTGSIGPYYKPSSLINKNEDLLTCSFMFSTTAASISLKLVSIDDKHEFHIASSGKTTIMMDGAFAYYHFNIGNIPAGKYEAYSIFDNYPSTITEKYPRILTIR